MLHSQKFNSMKIKARLLFKSKKQYIKLVFCMCGNHAFVQWWNCMLNRNCSFTLVLGPLSILSVQYLIRLSCSGLINSLNVILHCHQRFCVTFSWL